MKLKLVFKTPLQVQMVPVPPPLRARVTSKVDGLSLTGVGDMAYQLPNDKQIEVGISYVDAKGNPAVVDGAVTWTSSDETIMTIQPVASPPAGYPQGGVVMLVPVGPVGQAQASAVADADMGSGTTNITTLFDVQVLAGSAVAGTIQPIGDPVPNP